MYVGVVICKRCWLQYEKHKTYATQKIRVFVTDAALTASPRHVSYAYFGDDLRSKHRFGFHSIVQGSFGIFFHIEKSFSFHDKRSFGFFSILKNRFEFHSLFIDRFVFHSM